MRGSVKSWVYFLYHVVSSRKHLIVPESQHLITRRNEFFSAFRVISSLLLMLTAIDFDHELSF